ncbi:uncharacterized protein Dwil_GK25546 [Drosophila willistoni]|uniref:Uncharacterized protein n=1 Tax=Drosophila willistoni TaxID=7260 RepID=B4NDZ7_DROWI|nr:uncharacterized protein LOC6648589 [Drosophila willistoni]EDW81966.2 uncharacterized protein Dwil_GK25546 [Drosophila willistoni]
MHLNPERLEYYQKRLSQLLQNATQHIRSYHNELTTLKGPQLIEQTQNLWELSQRYRLVASSNASAGLALLSACQDVFTAIYETISQLNEDLIELAKDVKEFQLECRSLQAEQDDEWSHLVDWNTWLKKTLIVFQTQAKYLELSMRSMLPKRIENSVVEQFRKDLQLPENYVASIYLGLAKAHLKPGMLLPTR